MKCIFVGVEKEPFIFEMEDELNNFQALVGGHIEVMSIHSKNSRSIDIIFNEEGKLINLESNKIVVFPNGQYDAIMGNIVIVAADVTNGEFVSLTDEEANWYKNLFLDDYIFIV